MTRLLNQRNAPITKQTLASLDLQPTDRFLDVGLGGGGALKAAAEQVHEGHAYGVDISDDMVATAQRRLQRLVRTGRVSILRGDVVGLPFRDGLMDKVSTINTIYFWPDPASAMESLKRVIAPDGVLAIGFTGADKMSRYGKVTEHGFRWYRPEEVAALVEASGFRDVRTMTLDGKITRGDFVVLGRR
jgi:ubiquinone/menaquinone biosynthesis C-methylase UbiE